MKELIITGRHYRILGKIQKTEEGIKRLWYRISWWTAAKDVEFKDGTTLEEKYNEVEVFIGASQWAKVTETGKDAYYKYSLPLAKVTNRHPYVSLLPYLDSDKFPTAAELEDYSYITAVEVAEKSLIFYALKKPEHNLHLEISGVIGL